MILLSPSGFRKAQTDVWLGHETVLMEKVARSPGSKLREICFLVVVGVGGVEVIAVEPSRNLHFRFEVVEVVRVFVVYASCGL